MEILIKDKYKFSKDRIIVLVLCALILVSCRKKDATVKLPEVPEQLVILSFISPQDSVIKVSLTLTQPLYNNAASNQFANVENATVIISSALGSSVLVFDPATKNYVIDSLSLKIREGIKYTITASTPDGKSANASTQIPLANKTLSIEIDTNSANLKCTWLDPSTTTDYYRVFLEHSDFYVFESHTMMGDYMDTIHEKGVYAEWMLDTENPGGVLTKNFEYFPYTDSTENVYIYLLHVSKEYYDFGIKLPLAEVTDNPFAEPVPMYSNVNGGYGIFAGYTSYRRKVN